MRALISFAVAAVAVIFQITVVDRIAFPGGTGPDVVLLAVAALALAGGPLLGALIGFWAGLALDVAPPGSHLVGQNALVFCIVGYACGLLAEEPAREGTSEQGHTALFEIVVTALGAVFGEALSALLGAMLSDPRVTWPAIKHVLPVAAAYDVLLAPFVLFAVAAALRLAPARGDRSRPAWSGLAAQAAVPGAAQGAIRHVGTPNPPRLRLSDHGRSERWIGSLAGQGTAVKPAPKREPRLNLGRAGPLPGSPLGRRPPAKREPRLNLGRGGSLAGSTAGAAFVVGGGPAKVRFAARRSEGVLGGSLLGGSPTGSAALRSSRFGRSRMGRSLLGGSVFSRSSPTLNRPAQVSRSAPLGRSAFLGRTSWLGWPFSSPGLMRPAAGGTAGRTPRFSRGSSFSRLTGALHRSARPSTAPRSPGRGWLRRTSSRSGALGKGALGRRTMGRKAFGRGTSGRSGVSRGWTGASAPQLGSGRSRPFGSARLHMPRPMAKRKRRTGGYR